MNEGLYYCNCYNNTLWILRSSWNHKKYRRCIRHELGYSSRCKGKVDISVFIFFQLLSLSSRLFSMKLEYFMGQISFTGDTDMAARAPPRRIVTYSDSSVGSGADQGSVACVHRKNDVSERERDVPSGWGGTTLREGPLRCQSPTIFIWYNRHLPCPQLKGNVTANHSKP